LPEVNRVILKNESVKKHIYRERFVYISSRGKDAVSDVIWGIKLRGGFLTVQNADSTS
jgi:hypothetical protein